MDYRNIIAGKIERNDPEHCLSAEIDVYFRYNWALAEIKRSGKSNPRILELGCGLGWFGKVVANTLPKVDYVGIDIDEDVIAEARRRHSHYPILQFIQGDVCRLDEVKIQHHDFDFIIWFENLEHLQPLNFLGLVGQVKSFLNPGGLLLVEVPNRIGGGGLRASGPMHLKKGQHNPHHYLEPTLAEVKFLFPEAWIMGYDPGDQLSLFLKKMVRGLSLLLCGLGLARVECHIDHQGAFKPDQLAYLAFLRRFPSLNRCFLIKNK